MSKAKDSPLIEKMGEKFKDQILQDESFRKHLGADISESLMAERCYLAGAKAMQTYRENEIRVLRHMIKDTLMDQRVLAEQIKMQQAGRYTDALVEFSHREVMLRIERHEHELYKLEGQSHE